MSFSVHAKDGATVALHDHFDDALRAMKRIDDAESVVRIEDGEVLATKSRFGRMKPLPVRVLS